MQITSVAPSGAPSINAPSGALSIKAFYPSRFRGKGPAATCLTLLEGMTNAGADCSIEAVLWELGASPIPHRSVLPAAFGRLPYRFFGKAAVRRAESVFLRRLREGEIAYLWPGASLSLYRAVHARGNPIVMEGINTRMKSAKRILDLEYARLGLPPGQRISARSVALQEEKLGLASAFFAPSPRVEESLAGGPLDPSRIIATSYGVHLGSVEPKTAYATRDRLKVLFVGTLCLRKGVHLLLDAWSRAGIDGDLVLAGRLEPEVGRLCAEHLARPDVRLAGFVRDPRALYRAADVFVMPSLEEGGPLVTYEAAAHGLPMVLSPMGAGRIGPEAEAFVLDPHQPEAMVEALRALAGSEALRRRRGEAARRAALRYDWGDVTARRLAQLRLRM